MSELTVGSLSGLAANSYEIDIAPGSTLDLANAKAASLPVSAINGSVGGLVHISTVTMSSVSAQSFDDVFSSDYDFYRVMIHRIPSTSSSIFVRMRLSGTDDTGSNYTHQRLFAGSTQVTGLRSENQSSWNIGKTVVDPGPALLDIFNPAVASETSFIGQNMNSESTAAVEIFVIHGRHYLDTAYDGISFVASAGTMSGLVSIYGYSKG